MKRLFINKKEYFVCENHFDKTLLYYLREILDLTGTKNGCGKGFCGTCTVILNNRAVKSCNITMSEIKDDSKIITIEGIESPDGSLSPIQQAFVDFGAIQCGFCTPGMVMTAHAFLLSNPNPSREDIKKAISPNLCRCTGYKQIIDAIEYASRFYDKSNTK
ncbi:MAG: (2Fe-2S)-binding protein [Deltaproteobacteria bacterium]|nr:(2Fe-2S)-binding protein [Deltaproteobacteria bacterium]